MTIDIGLVISIVIIIYGILIVMSTTKIIIKDYMKQVKMKQKRDEWEKMKRKNFDNHTIEETENYEK